MDGKTLAQVGAIVFVAIAVTATAIDLTRRDEPRAPQFTPVVNPSVDPLREGQRRCQRLGEAAASDPECLAVWAETRDRFLGRSPTPDAPGSPERR
jgi:conjugative transfer region protein TrbK